MKTTLYVKYITFIIAIFIFSNCHSKSISETPPSDPKPFVMEYRKDADSLVKEYVPLEHFKKVNPLFKKYSIDSISIKTIGGGKYIAVTDLYPNCASRCVRKKKRINYQEEINPLYEIIGISNEENIGISYETTSVPEDQYNKLMALIDGLFISKTIPIEIERVNDPDAVLCHNDYIKQEVIFYYNTSATLHAPSVKQTEKFYINYEVLQDGDYIITFSPELKEFAHLSTLHVR